MSLARTHRTVLFVDGPALKANPSYLERVRRLAESLGGVNIKYDAYTIFPEKTSASGIVSGISTSSPTNENNYFDSERLLKLARDAGYTQTLVSHSTRG